MSSELHLQFFGNREVDETLLSKVVGIYQDEKFTVNAVIVNKNEYKNPINDDLARIINESLSFQEIMLTFYNSELKLEMVQYVLWGEKIGGKRRFILNAYTDNTPYFWSADSLFQPYVNIVLNLGKKIYSLFEPIFGFCDFSDGSRINLDEIERYQISSLYWANFLSPQMILPLGEKKVLEAPNWCIDKLEPAGVLYLLGDGPGTAKSHVAIEDVKKYFNIDLVR